MKNTKVVFMGTPEFAVPILEMLIEKCHVVLVVTQPDKCVGRKQKLTYSPIKQVATKKNIAVFQPQKIKKKYAPILEAKPDIIITCAYGQIIPKEVLDFPVFGCINVHASLLPKYRGGAPIHRAIINGEKQTGVTIMYMDEHMDTGDIIAQRSTEILESDNVGTLHDKLSNIGTKLLEEVLPSIIKKTNSRKKQNDKNATYAYNITREEEKIDFSKSGKEIINQIRGLYPWPTAYFILDEEEQKALEGYFEKRMTEETGVILELKKDAIGITCQDGIIYLTKIKPFGKKAMAIKDYLNGIKKETLIKKKVN